MSFKDLCVQDLHASPWAAQGDEDQGGSSDRWQEAKGHRVRQVSTKVIFQRLT